MQKKSLRSRLLNAIRQQAMSALADNRRRIVLAEPPFQLPRDIAPEYHAGTPLTSRAAKSSFPAHGVLRYWPQLQVHSSHYPYLGFVLRGTIDWRIGITAQAARQHKGKLSHSDSVSLELGRGTFFLMPPGVPYASGERTHRNPHATDSPDYQVLWMRFLPSGAECHFCWTVPGGQVSETDYFVPDPHLLSTTTALIDELRQRGQADLSAAQSLLYFILHRLAYNLVELQEKRRGLILESSELKHDSDAAIELACRYIEAHSHEKLALSEIAKHSFVSSGHLSRIFRRQKGVTLNQYITQHRLKRACALLRGSSLSIDSVGKSVGYPDNAYFSRLFSSNFGCPPLEFRQRHLREHHKKSTNVAKSQK